MDEFSGSTLSASDVVILTDLNCITDADSISTSFQYRLVDASKTNGWFDVDSSNVSYSLADVCSMYSSKETISLLIQPSIIYHSVMNNFVLFFS